MAASNTAEIMALDEAGLIAVIKDSEAGIFERAKACQRLAVTGTKEAVPALAALLSDPKLAHYARFGLEPIPHASVDEALRSALEKLDGPLAVGVISSIGCRKDSAATGVLSKLLDDSDTEVAQAAAAALGKIGGHQAAKRLQKALAKNRAAGPAALVCAEGLLAAGDRDQALSLYKAVHKARVPEPVRAAAERGMEAARS